MRKTTTDENNMIQKPAVFARTIEKLDEDEWGFFNTSGWLVYARVQQVYEEENYQRGFLPHIEGNNIDHDLDISILNDSDYDTVGNFIIYMVDNIDWIFYYGVEMTETEQIEYDKKKNKIL